MAAQTEHSSAPSTDKRWKIVEATMRRHGFAGDALIESLHSAQECFGYLEEDGLRYVASSLHVPLSKVFGVATFYHFFTLKPPGRHTCVVCMGTACYIKGAGELLAAIQDKYSVEAGHTTEDGWFSVLTARCLGSCSLAPAAVFDGEVAGRLNPAALLTRIDQWSAS
jgi:bidirectional [NiFe] hydrogenase diaphorase subunit